MLRFKPCPLFVFLNFVDFCRDSAKFMLAWFCSRCSKSCVFRVATLSENSRLFYQFCNSVAKVRIIFETTKLFARRMQLNLFKTAEPRQKFSEAKLFCNFFREFCKFLFKTSRTASAYLNFADCRFLTRWNYVSRSASRSLSKLEIRPARQRSSTLVSALA